MSVPRLTPSERREVGERYQSGETIPQLAEVYSVTWGVIHRALIKERVSRRSASEARSTGRNRDELNPCRECGMGCHPNAVKPLCVDCSKLFCQDAECNERLPKAGQVKTRYCSACKFRMRYKKKPPRLCRVCGRMGARGTTRELCNVHVKHFCSTCDEPKPPQRVLHRCTACENDKKQRMYLKPERMCAFCGIREVKVHSSRCQHCLHEDYEIWRWGLLHIDRPCRKCGVTLARGRQVNYCAKCQGQRMKQRNRERLAIGAHRCAMCKEELPLARDTYCGGCSTMLANWRRSWHQGNKVARSLGTVRTPERRWQERVEEMTQRVSCGTA